MTVRTTLNISSRVVICLFLSDVCDGGVFKNPSGDRICWVQTATKKLRDEGRQFCQDLGYQGYAEIRTPEDDQFLAVLRSCEGKIMENYCPPDRVIKVLFPSSNRVSEGKE